MSLPNIAPYAGPLNPKTMPHRERIAYEAFNSQKARSKRDGLPAPTYGPREFIGWWLKELKSFKGTVPTCGRIDHSKGYSWDNVFMQDMKDNSREGLLRNKTHLKTKIKNSKSVAVVDQETGEIAFEFLSIRETASHFGVSQRLVQFLVRGKYKQSKKIPFILQYGGRR